MTGQAQAMTMTWYDLFAMWMQASRQLRQLVVMGERFWEEQCRRVGWRSVQLQHLVQRSAARTCDLSVCMPQHCGRHTLHAQCLGDVCDTTGQATAVSVCEHLGPHMQPQQAQAQTMASLPYAAQAAAAGII